MKCEHGETYTYCLHHYCCKCNKLLGFDGMLCSKPEGSIWSWNKKGDELIEMQSQSKSK